MTSLIKERSSLQNCKGCTRDLTAEFNNFKKKKTPGFNWQEEEQKLRERFKPLNSKFSKKKPKEKVDSDEIRYLR